MLAHSRPVQIPAKLQVHPECWARAEVTTQPQCRARGDTSSAVDELVHALVRDMDAMLCKASVRLTPVFSGLALARSAAGTC